MGREKLPLVEHVTEDLLKTDARGHRQEVDRVLTRGGLAVDLDESGGKLGPVLEKPLQADLVTGITGILLGCDVTGRKERNESHDRAHLDRDALLRELEMVVVEAVLLVPEPRPTEIIHRLDDAGVVGDELRPHVGVDGIMNGEFQRHPEHRQAVERHPGRTVGLLERPARGKRLGTVKDGNVVEAQESTLEEVVPIAVLAVHPPSEVDEKLLEDLLQELRILAASELLLIVKTQGGPGMDRGIHVREVPLVGGHLAVGMRVPLPQKKDQLVLAERGIDPGKGRRVKGQIPGAVVGVLPGVRHGDDVTVKDVLPIGVTLRMAARGSRFGGVPPLPLGLDQVVELLGPEQAGIGLPGDVPLFGIQCRADRVSVKFVRLGDPRPEGALKTSVKGLPVPLATGSQTHVKHLGLPGTEGQVMASRRLGAEAFRIQNTGRTFDHRIMKSILEELAWRICTVEATGVGLVVGEKKLRKGTVGRLLEGEQIFPHHGMAGAEDPRPLDRDPRLLQALLSDLPPSPRVAEP